MTSTPLAEFMASLFSQNSGPIRLLEAGAGVGSLIAAFLAKWGTSNCAVWAYEIDNFLSMRLSETLANYSGEGFEASIVKRDFIEDSVFRLKLGKHPRFTHAILNPPYKKISSDSKHRALLRAIGLETVNLYTAFVGLAIELMMDGGQIVAIIPRSFCNGLYYRPFRRWLLEKSAIEQIHLFHSRTSAFSDDDVLQENIILKLVKGQQQKGVAITTSSNTDFSDLQRHNYEFSDIVHPNDPQSFIHVPMSPTGSGINGLNYAQRSLDEIGLEVSTGPVVDFRLKKFLRRDSNEDTVPLLYATHFLNGKMLWPRKTKKPNALIHCSETKKWLYPSGYYTVVRRFSSKEERHRIVAHVVDPKQLGSDAIGFENHLNVFHSGKKGLDTNIAHGLSVFLNSTAIDEYFRRFSGHTQVNATDLRLLKYPDTETLKQLGQWAQKQQYLTQTLIDSQLEKIWSGESVENP
jgi:adenine-specific DNA-methyltransferase